MDSLIPNKDIRLIAILFPVLGLVFTIPRLFLRFRSGSFWWDDALAFASAVFTSTMSAATYIHYMDPAPFSRTTLIVAYYELAESFYVTLWLSRLSILFSILRITPEAGTRKLLVHTSIAFAFVCAFLCAQVFWVCETQPNWKKKPQPQCALGLQVAVCQLITDIAADSLLIAVPLRLFSRSKLERALKIRLIVIFSAASLTTIVSLVHAAYILKDLGPQAIISGIAEISVSLIVCNFAVVLPAFWRSCGVYDTLCRHEQTFKLSTVQFAEAPSPVHAVGARSTLDEQDDVMGVTGILHDRMRNVTAEPPGRKGARLEFPEEHSLDPPRKGGQDWEGDLEEALHVMHGQKKTGT